MRQTVRSRRRGLFWLAALLVILGCSVLLKGCSVTVTPPLQVDDPVAVYIIDYGRHPGLILPRDDERFVEYAFGEWQWYALNRTGLRGAMRAMFKESDGTLGRRDAVASANGRPRLEGIPARHVHRLEVERTRAAQLRDSLDHLWETHRDSEVYNEARQMHMVRIDEPYSMGNNSNTMLSRWLQTLDCKVRGWTAYPAGWRIEESQSR